MQELRERAALSVKELAGLQTTLRVYMLETPKKMTPFCWTEYPQEQLKYSKEDSSRKESLSLLKKRMHETCFLLSFKSNSKLFYSFLPSDASSASSFSSSSNFLDCSFPMRLASANVNFLKSHIFLCLRHRLGVAELEATRLRSS